ncbi:MAG: DMT family transporter [Solirubrobacterales bacterium]
MQNRQKFIPYISVTCSSIIFGLSFLFSKRALTLASPFELLSFRFLTAFCIMSILVITGIIKINYKRKPIITLLFLGLCQPILYFIFETYGIKYSTSSQAGLMIALIPVFVSILGAYFLKEIPSKKQIFCIMLSISGVILIILMGNSEKVAISVTGTIMLVFAVFCAASFNILSRKLSNNFTPFEITYFMMGLGAVFFNIISLINKAASGNLHGYFVLLTNIDFIISIGYLGILSSLIAFFLVNYTLSKISASISSAFSNLSTIVTVAAGVFFLNESFKYYHFVGAIMILFGVWGSSYFQNKSETGLEVIELEE